MEYRYERKIFIERINRKDVEMYVKMHPMFFKEIFYKRVVNNIYFDFLNFNNFNDNIIGNTNRLKYRIRWYGDFFNQVTNPKLELKIKKGIVGTKKAYLLNDFLMKKEITSSEIKDIILSSNIDSVVKMNINAQVPVIINRYRRTYFQSLDKRFRITIDDNQEFYKVNTLNNKFLNKRVDKENVILELKYNIEDDFDAQKILKNFPFRITKSSKYSRAIEMFYV